MTTARRSPSELRESDGEGLTPYELAWREWFIANPDWLAVWGYSNGRWPPGHDAAGED